MICVANETVAADAPAPHGEAPAPDEPDREPVAVLPDVEPVVVLPDVEPVVVLPDVEPDGEPLPPLGVVVLEQPAAAMTEATVAKERMFEIGPRIKTVLSRLP